MTEYYDQRINEIFQTFIKKRDSFYFNDYTKYQFKKHVISFLKTNIIYLSIENVDILMYIITEL